MSTDKPELRDLFRYGGAYETGGLLYFQFEGKEMVAIIRDRTEFDSHLKRGTTLEKYVDAPVSWKAYGAALVLEELIPEKSIFYTPEVPQ